MNKKKVIVLTKNYEKYISGNYHMDLVHALEDRFEVYKYGEGYPEYNSEDEIGDVIRKSLFHEDEIYAVVVATSWEKEEINSSDSDPHPKIVLNQMMCKKVFFLNKEYQNIKSKLQYIKKNKFDLVVTVLPRRTFCTWEAETGIPFFQSHFGINTDEFIDMNLPRKYDLTFTGNLHRQYTDKRVRVKNELFVKDIKSNLGRCRVLNVFNPIRKEYRGLNIYWAEWGAKRLLGETLLPSGKEYAKLMCQSKVYFSTLSADGIFGTRFFEIMATKALLFCPEDDYYGLLKDGFNCTMYKEDLSDFKEKLFCAIYDTEYRENITKNAFESSLQQNYTNRLEGIFNKLENIGNE